MALLACLFIFPWLLSIFKNIHVAKSFAIWLGWFCGEGDSYFMNSGRVWETEGNLVKGERRGFCFWYEKRGVISYRVKTRRRKVFFISSDTRTQAGAKNWNFLRTVFCFSFPDLDLDSNL
ncbi:hypothetical protein F4809DRAFT_238016 [Biscogniauxia mediterranea]|nr:hypothetical protein F4809DRAFT_238016 [Biscogniauxia mediterranea]